MSNSTSSWVWEHKQPFCKLFIQFYHGFIPWFFDVVQLMLKRSWFWDSLDSGLTISKSSDSRTHGTIAKTDLTNESNLARVIWARQPTVNNYNIIKKKVAVQRDICVALIEKMTLVYSQINSNRNYWLHHHPNLIYLLGLAKLKTIIIHIFSIAVG